MRHTGRALIATLALAALTFQAPACVSSGDAVAGATSADARATTSPATEASPHVPGSPLKGTDLHGAIASAVGVSLLTGHYSGRPINDALSEQWLNNYIDALDYSRIYFLQSDIDSFAKWSTTLDDDLLRETPELEAAWVIHERYLQRVDERISYALRTLDGSTEFASSDTCVDIDRHDDPWATDAAQLDQIWHDRLAEQLLRMTLSDIPALRPPTDPPPLTAPAPAAIETRTPLERLRRRYERTSKEVHDVLPEDVLESYLGALSAAFDPHSNWFKPISKENFDIEMRDTLTGIGAELGSDEGYTVIRGLIAGGPAEASGELKPNDKILAVGQDRDGELVDIVDMRLDRVVQLIRGPSNTTVHLVIHPADAVDPAELRDVYLVRDKVKLSNAAASGEVRELPGAAGPVSVGYIDVPSFYVDAEGQRRGDPNYGSTTRDVEKILADFRAKGVQSLVIDLRRNGGGSLDEALQLTGLFLPGGPVVQIRSRDDKIEVLRDEDPTVAWSGPVVVLISEGSASASEIFAGALQDYGIGLVVGSDATHGKGTVQNLIGLDRFLRRSGHGDSADAGGALKFTTHMFFRVNGESTQIRGVRSDIVLPSPYAGMKIKEEHLEAPLPWDRIPAARYRRLPMKLDVPALTAASRARVAADAEFSLLGEDLARRAEYEARTCLSLDASARQAESEGLIAEDKAREAARRARGWDGEADIDPIRDEALLIARDIVEQRPEGRTKK